MHACTVQAYLIFLKLVSALMPSYYNYFSHFFCFTFFGASLSLSIPHATTPPINTGGFLAWLEARSEKRQETKATVGGWAKQKAQAAAMKGTRGKATENRKE